jgi:hypothetical protein
VLFFITELARTVLVFRIVLVLTVLVFHIELVSAVLVSRTVLVLTVLLYLTELVRTLLVFRTVLVLMVLVFHTRFGCPGISLLTEYFVLECSYRLNVCTGIFLLAVIFLC